MAGRRKPHMRARDTDRNNTCQILDGALAEGQLSFEEHRTRVAVATKAATLGELQGLVTDLQPTDSSTHLAPRAPRLSGRGRLLVAAGITGLLAVIIAVVVAVVGGPDSAPSTPDVAALDPESAPDVAAPGPASESAAAPARPTDPGAAPDGVPPSVVTVPKQLHTLGGMTAVLDSIRQRFGDTIGIELAIFADEAMLYRLDPNDDQSKLLYHFRGGWGDPTPTPRDDKDLPADLGAFDVKAVVGVLRGAAEIVGIKPADVSEVVVDIDHTQDPTGPGALELLVKVSDSSGGDGYIYLDSAGNTKRVEYPG